MEEIRINTIAGFFHLIAHEEAWRGPDCWERDEQGLEELLCRHVLGHYRFDVSTLPYDDWGILVSDLQPYSPEVDAEWKPKNRIAQATRSFLILMGLYELSDRLIPATPRHDTVANFIASVHDYLSVYGLPLRFRKHLERIGRESLRNDANDSE